MWAIFIPYQGRTFLENSASLPSSVANLAILSEKLVRRPDGRGEDWGPPDEISWGDYENEAANTSYPLLLLRLP